MSRNHFTTKIERARKLREKNKRRSAQIVTSIAFTIFLAFLFLGVVGTYLNYNPL